MSGRYPVGLAAVQGMAISGAVNGNSYRIAGKSSIYPQRLECRLAHGIGLSVMFYEISVVLLYLM